MNLDAYNSEPNKSSEEQKEFEKKIEKALEHFQKREFSLALTYLNEAVELSRKLRILIPNLYLTKAYSEMQLGLWPEAFESIEKECQYFPQNPRGLNLKMQIETLYKEKYERTSEMPAFIEQHKQLEGEITSDSFIASVIIPVYNNLEYTRQCINSILENTPEFNEIQFIIVDNASTDGTGEYLSNLCKEYKNIEVISNSENLGFAKGCNQGIRAAKSKFIVLLNNDIVVTKGWLSNLIQEAQMYPDVGIVGSRLLYPNSNIIQHIGVKFAKVLDYHPYHYSKLRDQKYVPEAEISTDYNCVTFACVLIKKEVFDKIGLLDEEYINSYEDVDFCIRAREAGFRIRYCAKSILYHYESKTPKRHKYDQRNFELLNKKWKFIFDKYVDKERGLHEVWDIWFREGLEKNPNNLYFLLNLCITSGNLNRLEEYQYFKNKLTSKVIEFKNSKPVISLIIQTHNNWLITKLCIQSIFSTMRNLNYEIIFVDNDSSDETRKNLRFFESLGLIKVIYNTPEKTYAEANNQGAKIARGEYLVFMNNDVFVLDNWSENLIETFRKFPEIGIQGAKLIYQNKLIQHSGIVFKSLKDGLKYHYHIYLGKPEAEKCVSKSREMQAVTGSFLAIRRELFEQIGGFDEFYQFGFEDLDICMAVRRLGFKVWYNAEVKAIHLESATKKLKGLEKFVLDFTDPNNLQYKNHDYFYKKWGNFVQDDDYKYYQEDNEQYPFANLND